MKNKENNQEGVFVRHESCEACGSRDNRAVYDNGDKMTYYCFGCEDTGIYNDDSLVVEKTPKEFKNIVESVDDIKDYPVRGFRERKITKDIAELYGVKVGYSEEDGKTIKYHYYPITEKGKVVGYERRDLDAKRFLAIGSVKNKNEFFGQSKFAPGSCKRIVVTEGALDAMSVQQVWKDKKQEWAVVSVINGAQGAYKQVVANLDYLNSFEEVVFLFDHDEAGRDGAEACARLVRTGKAKIGALGRYGKDASDYLVSGKTYELEKAIWNAEMYSPAGIVNSADTWDLFNEDRREDSVPYPDCFANVNKMTYGRRTGELTIFTAGTGNPFFTTDTAGCLRAIETQSDLMLKATRVEGVYDSDPETNKDAKFFDSLTFDEAISKNLKVMDATALTLARDHELPINVFKVSKKDALKDIICGKKIGTLIS